MDSKVMKINHATNKSNLLGSHYIELISDKVTYDSNTGKFIMSYLTPNLSNEAYDTTLPRNGASNVINRNQLSLGVSNIIASNYVELPVPKYLFYITDVTVTHPEHGKPSVKIARKEYLKGQKFIVTNISGNYDNPRIIGVVE